MAVESHGMPTREQEENTGSLHQCNFTATGIVGLVGIFMPLKEEQICEGDGIVQYAEIHNKQNTVKSPEHMTKLLKQTLRICETPGVETQVRQLLTAYADVFSGGKTDVRRMDPGTMPIRQPPR